jgi:hypothetical protein
VRGLEIMLKKFSHITLSAILLVSTIGMAVSKHYCSGTLVSVSLFKVSDSCCGDADCCHNENHYYNVKDDFSIPQISNVPVLAEVDILGHDLLNELLTTNYESNNTILTFTDSPPPPLIQTTLSSLQTYRL